MSKDKTLQPYLGFLKVGDKIETEFNKKKISVTLTGISIDPTWGGTGGLLIEINHTVDGESKDTSISLSNFQSWFDGKSIWRKVE